MQKLKQALMRDGWEYTLGFNLESPHLSMQKRALATDVYPHDCAEPQHITYGIFSAARPKAPITIGLFTARASATVELLGQKTISVETIYTFTDKLLSILT